MDCAKFQKFIDQMIDGRIADECLLEHERSCASCRTRIESGRSLERLIRSSREDLELSPEFEAVFWRKVSARQKESWLAGWRRRLDVVRWTPSFRQAVALTVAAFLIGHFGGLVSGIHRHGDAPRISQGWESVPGLPGLNGAPRHSLAESYLLAVSGEGSG